MTRRSKAVLTALTIVTAVLGILAAPSGRAIAQPVPAYHASVHSPHAVTRLLHRAVKAVAKFPRSYTVRPGDYLSSIAGDVYGKPGDWPVLFWANHPAVKYADLIYTGQHLVIPALPAKIPAAPAAMAPSPVVTTASPAGNSLAGEDSDSSSAPAVHRTAPVSSGGSYTPPSGNYSCSALEQLWVSAGGSSSAAFTAAEIAMAESGGNPGAISPTDDFGLWQINGSNAPGKEMLNPSANVREAISLSGNGSNWDPWTTYTSGAYQGKCSGSAIVTTRVVIPKPAPHPAPSSRAARAVQFAYDQLGCPYVYGGTGPCSSGFDCSGLVQAAWRYAGVSIERTTYEQWSSLEHISRSDLQPGDLVFGNGFGHVMLYVGNGYVIQAPHTGANVEKTSLSYVGTIDGYARA